MVSHNSLALACNSSVSIASTSKGLILMDKEILFFELFLGLGHLLPGILNIGATSTDSSLASFSRGLLFFLLGLHHFLAFLLSLFQTLAFFLLFCGSFFSFSFSQLLLFFLLLLSQFLFLFSSDLLAFGLFLL